MVNLYVPSISITDEELLEMKMQGETNMVDIDIKEAKEKEVKIEEFKNKLIQKRSKIENWRRKCYRFLAYCLNGGLTDYSLTFDFIIELCGRVQNLSLLGDINDFIFNSINFRDADIVGIDEPPKIYIPSMNERTNLSFNEEILCVCIRTGWLSKCLSESVKHAPAFVKLLLRKFGTNKMLSSINLFLKYVNDQTGEDGANAEERHALNILIGTLVEIYGDYRKNPTTIVLAAKCLCALVLKDNDKKNKIIMIQEDIVPKISFYFDYYDFDEKLMLISLELLSLVLPELKGKINEYLSDSTGVNILSSFKKILRPSVIPGTYHSQRVNH